MKKWLSLILSLMLLMSVASVFAEAAPALDDSLILSPFAQPALPEDIHTRWQLYTEEPAPEWKMTALSDPETNLFTIILYNPMEWGIAPEYHTNWIYDIEAETWVVDSETDIRREDAVILSIDAQHYYMNGFPGWECVSKDETFAYQLSDYSDDPNNPMYHLQYRNDTASIQLSLSDGGYSMSSYSETTMSYSVYDANGVLSLAIYMTENDEGELAQYSIIANESTDPEAVAKEPYVLYYINVQTPDGGNYLWTEGAWQNIHGEEVTGPKGYNPDELPFTLIVE